MDNDIIAITKISLFIYIYSFFKGTISSKEPPTPSELEPGSLS